MFLARKVHQVILKLLRYIAGFLCATYADIFYNVSWEQSISASLSWAWVCNNLYLHRVFGQTMMHVFNKVTWINHVILWSQLHQGVQSVVSQRTMCSRLCLFSTKLIHHCSLLGTVYLCNMYIKLPLDLIKNLIVLLALENVGLRYNFLKLLNFSLDFS